MRLLKRSGAVGEAGGPLTVEVEEDGGKPITRAAAAHAAKKNSAGSTTPLWRTEVCAGSLPELPRIR